ncbi:hypothetical protein HK101_000398 [Irineochytrium annulatum]|nr:hypothetical protein HK101_000398 [Irineochytrium annulatum]
MITMPATSSAYHRVSVFSLYLADEKESVWVDVDEEEAKGRTMRTIGDAIQLLPPHLAGKDLIIQMKDNWTGEPTGPLLDASTPLKPLLVKPDDVDAVRFYVVPLLNNAAWVDSEVPPVLGELEDSEESEDSDETSEEPLEPSTGMKPSNPLLCQHNGRKRNWVSSK